MQLFYQQHYAADLYNKASVYDIKLNTVAPVPESETYALIGLGLVGLIAARRRKTFNA